MALTLIPLNEVPAGLDAMPLGTKGEIAAFVLAFLASGLHQSPVIHGVTASQVQGIKKALKDADASHVTPMTLSSITGRKVYNVTRERKDGTPFTYEVARDVRTRYGIYLENPANAPETPAASNDQ